MFLRMGEDLHGIFHIVVCYLPTLPWRGALAGSPSILVSTYQWLVLVTSLERKCKQTSDKYQVKLAVKIKVSKI